MVSSDISACLDPLNLLKTFCVFSMGRNQYWAERVYDLCVYYMTGTPEGSTESGFMEKPGIEPATPGLQGIALIHYTTGASQPAIGDSLSYTLPVFNKKLQTQSNKKLHKSVLSLRLFLKLINFHSPYGYNEMQSC